MRAIALFAAAAAVQAAVLQLTPDTFDDHVGKDKTALVKFFAPWCGHCKSMAPAYEEVSGIFKASDPVVVAEVNCDEHKDLCSRFGVRGYPTLKWFDAGSSDPTDYAGGRSVEDFVTAINEKVGTSRRVAKAPSSVVELTASNFDAVILGTDLNKWRLVEYYASWCGHCKTLAPVYEKVAAAFEGEPSVTVAKVDADKHRSVGERFGVSGFPTLKVFAPGESEPTDYTGGRDGESFVRFLNEKAGSHRTLEGGLTPQAGRLEAFDALAQEFAGAASKDGKAAVLARAREAVAALETAAEKAKAEAYVKVMAKALEKGDAWVGKEAARLEAMAASESIGRAKRFDFLTRRNVLAAFAPAE